MQGVPDPELAQHRVKEAVTALFICHGFAFAAQRLKFDEREAVWDWRDCFATAPSLMCKRLCFSSGKSRTQDNPCLCLPACTVEHAG